MAKIRTYTLTWGASVDTDVVGYRLRWAVPPAVIDYSTTYLDLGKVTTIQIPVAGMPSVNGNVTLGLTAVDNAGNESDIATITTPFDFIAPAPPTNLKVS
jgi:hypothetical protein